MTSLPSDPSTGITCVSSSAELGVALADKQRMVIVLRPGKYSLDAGMFMELALGAACQRGVTLVGLGKSELRSHHSHAVFVPAGQLTLVGLKLVGSGSLAAVCVATMPQTAPQARQTPAAAQAHLRMLRCCVEDYGEVGLLVTDHAQADLVDCRFSNTAKQAIEVRQGGCLTGHGLHIEGCLQGVSAYGGARSVVLRGCTILKSKKEGVLAAGTYENAATQAQGIEEGSRSAAGREARAWGRKHGTPLEVGGGGAIREVAGTNQVSVVETTISRSGNFGISADFGAEVVVDRSTFELNDPYSIFIKGGTDVTALASRFTFTGGQSSAPWVKQQQAALKMAGAAAGAALHKINKETSRTSGIYVAVNYGGNVTVRGCAFSGPSDHAIFEEESLSLPAAATIGSKMMGGWSKRVTAADNLMLGTQASGGLPSVQELAQRLPADLRMLAAPGGLSQPRQRHVFIPSIALRRPAPTFTQHLWSPTSMQYYTIGNTFGHDITGGQLQHRVQALLQQDEQPAQKAPEQAPVRLLLAGCGDIRNLLSTVHAALGSAIDSDGTASGLEECLSVLPPLECVLNDGSVAMLARNAVLLHMIATHGTQGAEAVLNVWASHTLPEAHATLLSSSLHALAHKPWPAWLSASACLDKQQPWDEGSGSGVNGFFTQPNGKVVRGVSQPGAEQAIRAAIAVWAGCSITAKDLECQRSSVYGNHEIESTALKLSLAAVHSQSAQVTPKRVTDDVESYIKTGSLEAGTAPNPTFLTAPELQYSVYYSTSIFRALCLGPGDSQASARTRLLISLTPQLGALHAALHSGKLHISLVPGDILSLLITDPQLSHSASLPAVSQSDSSPAAGAAHDHRPSSGTSASTHCDSSSSTIHHQLPVSSSPVQPVFDFIDATNLADYISLPALLQACAPLLSCSSDSQPSRAFAPTLSCESFLGYRDAILSGGKQYQAVPAFVESQAGISITVLQGLLGLRLKSWETLPAWDKAIRMVWAAVPQPSIPVGTQPPPTAPPSDVSRQASSDAAAQSCTHSEEGTPGQPQPKPSSSCVSAGLLLLELLSACKQQVVPFTGTGTAGSGKGGKPPTVPALSPYSPGPVTLAHLLALAAPEQSEVLLRAMMRCEASGQANLFKWELVMHVMTQAGKGPPLVHLAYKAQPGYSLVPYASAPLLLAFTRKTLAKGRVDPSQVKQLLSSFAWDEDLGVAHFLLPAPILEQITTWFVTLCVRADVGLVATGVSAQLSALEAVAVGASPVPGTAIAVQGGGQATVVPAWRPSRAQTAVHLDISLLDQLPGTPAPAAAQREGNNRGWRSYVHVFQACATTASAAAAAGQTSLPQGQPTASGAASAQDAEGRGGVTVDILAPSPLPSPEDASLVVKVVDGKLVVSILPVKPSSAAGKPKGKAGVQVKKEGKTEGRTEGAAGVWPHEQEYAVQLPPGVCEGQPALTKLSRKLGLISAVSSFS